MGHDTDTEGDLEHHSRAMEPDEETDPPLGRESGRGSSNLRFRLQFFLCLVCLVEGMDIQLLPASFRAIELDLGMSPSALGTLAMGQALTQAASTPIWGAICDAEILSYKYILVLGTSAWGVITIFLGAAGSFEVMFGLRCINGVALASLMPVSQSVIADVTDYKDRGRAFGLIQFSLNAGQIISSFMATPLSKQNIAGVQGWRVSFFIVGCLSLALSLALRLFLKEPASRSETLGASPMSILNRVGAEFRKVSSYLGIPSFVVLVSQGLFGNITWNALSFITMWFQYIGMTDAEAAFLYSSCIFCGGFGAILGGMVGDFLCSHWSRWHGRPATAQASVFGKIPAMFAVLLFIPRTPDSFWKFWICMVVIGLIGVWAGVATNRPILIELVSAKSRASVVSWLTAFEGSAGALFGAPLVGILAEHIFHYDVEAAKSAIVADMSPEVRDQNVTALSSAILCLTVIPWLICFSFYSALHWTYKRDLTGRLRASNGTSKLEEVEMLSRNSL